MDRWCSNSHRALRRIALLVRNSEVHDFTSASSTCAFNCDGQGDRLYFPSFLAYRLRISRDQPAILANISNGDFSLS